MALEHSLYLAAPQPAGEVAAIVLRDAQQASIIPSGVGVEELLQGGVTLESGLLVLVLPRPPLPFEDPMVTELGIAASTYIHFRLYTSGDRDLQVDQMLWITMATLIRLPGDAVLTFQLEPIWLLRRGGELTLSDDEQFWTPERLELVTVPYTRKAMRFPD